MPLLGRAHAHFTEEEVVFRAGPFKVSQREPERAAESIKQTPTARGVARKSASRWAASSGRHDSFHGGALKTAT